MKNQQASTFNHLFELLQENFLGYLSPRRARRTLGTWRTWRTGWAWLMEDRDTKNIHASNVALKNLYISWLKVNIFE